MSKTSWEVKKRYNEKVYQRLGFLLDKNLVERFKEACKADGKSQASIIKMAIEDYLRGRE